MSLQLKWCKCYLYAPSNCQQSNQAWSTCFKCNTFFVLQVCFPWRFSQLLPAIPQLKSVFAYRSLCLTILSANRVSWIVSAVCWLSVICQLISASFNAQAIKCSTCRAEEWSIQQSNKYPVILYWFSIFVQVRLGKRLYKQVQVSICSSGGLSMPAWTKDSKLLINGA